MMPYLIAMLFQVYIYFLYNFYNYNNNYLLNLFLDLEASTWIDTVPRKSSSPDDDTVLKTVPVSQPLLITILSDIYSVSLLNKYYCRKIYEFRFV